MGSKEKICKCGHKKESHKKNPDSKLSFATYCRNCACNSYLNRNKPFKSDIFATIVMVATFIVFLVTSVVLLYELELIIEPIKDMPSHFTNGELYELLTILLFGLNAFLFTWFVVSPILTDYSNKKRIKFPIKDEDAKL